MKENKEEILSSLAVIQNKDKCVNYEKKKVCSKYEMVYISN